VDENKYLQEKELEKYCLVYKQRLLHVSKFKFYFFISQTAQNGRSKILYVRPQIFKDL